MRWQNSRGAVRAIRHMDAPTTRLNSRRHAAKQRQRHPNTLSSGTKNSCSGRIADRSKRCGRKTVFQRGDQGKSAYNGVVFEAEGNSSRKQEENPENAIATVPYCPACLFAFFFGLFSPDRGAWFRPG